MKLRQWIIALVAIAILIIAFLVSGMFSSMKQDPASVEEETIARKVKVDTVRYEEVPVTFLAAGRLGSHQYVNLIPQVQGELLPTRVPLKKGQSFKKGDLLIRIFDEEAAFNLKASRARFLNLIANALPDFKIDFPDRFDALMTFFESIDIDKKLPELPEIKSQKIKTFLSSRNILNEYYSIKSAEVRFSWHKIYAPFNGTYTEVNQEVGSLANPGFAVARIISTELLELEVPVEVGDIKWVDEGDQVMVYSEDYSNKWLGNVIRKADFVDPTTQAVSVFITVLPTRAQPLFEGQYLRAEFSGGKIPASMSIPRSAVFNANQVFSISGGKLAKSEITIMKVSQEEIIFNGIEENTVIVTEPLANAREGMPVTFQ
jgi:multidrug efflux pump subunit AcrA (membrane-fusion protein)